MALKLESPDLTEGAAIPQRFTCDGQDVSPLLHWSGAPAGTKSFALVVADPDAPSGTFFHWAVFDIPAGTAELPGGVANQETIGAMRQGFNDFNRAGYSGPCPPVGHGAHHYRFRLFALKVVSLGMREHAKAAEVEVRAQEQALATADFVAVYRR